MTKSTQDVDPRWRHILYQRRWLLGAIVVGLVVAIGVTRMVQRRPDSAQEDLVALTVPAEVTDLTVEIEATGEVQPIDRVNLSPKTQGRLEQIFVEQGDRVTQGQIIATMERRELDAQADQARARLDRARASLAELETGTRPEELAQADDRIDQARARSDGARASRDELLAGSRREDLDEADAAVRRAAAAVVDAESSLALAEIEADRNRQLEADGAVSRRVLDASLDELRRARANLDQVIAARGEAQQRRDRLENGARPEEIDRAEADLSGAEAELSETEQRFAQLSNGARLEEIDRAEADVLEAEAQVRFYEVQLNDTEIRAPFAGIIAQRYADPGAFVTPATSASTATSATSTSIVALARGIEVLAKVPEVDISRIYQGQSVEILADAYPNDRFEARVKLIAPEAVREQNVTLFQVRLEILGGLETLQSGMNVDLTFRSDQLRDALVVPTVAIVTDQGRTGVLIPDARGRATFQAVTIGPSVGSQVQVLEGIEAGDRVFIGLPEGQSLDDVLGGLSNED
jgi:HlyD family secretion protein